jgi:hypothetical protein
MIWEKLDPQDNNYELTRNIFLRSLGFIYFVAFLSLNRQVLALIGQNGLLPAQLYLHRIQEYLGASTFHSFLEIPSLFWWNSNDALLLWGSYSGLFLSVLIMFGATNALLMAAIWFLYMSFVHIGQIFYGYGWETMTLEAGFLAIFLCPVRSILPNPKGYSAPVIIMWFYRWMLFRVMFGAGLIKIRGDQCWRDLTCLAYHYETQPLPNPISWYLHHMPMWFHQAGCLFNHFAELIVPWFYFAPRRIRHVAGIITIVFQIILILSGNLSFLNWLTIVIAIPLFAGRASGVPEVVGRASGPPEVPGRIPLLFRKVILTGVSILLIALSIYPIQNMISPNQVMNTSFDRLHLMNTYGAFGSVSKVRYEIIIEGTNDLVPDSYAHWKAYEFLAKPGDPKQRPPFIAPYQSRIDWQMWFAAFDNVPHDPWLIHFVYKLLKNDRDAISLIKYNPFQDRPPLYVRAEYYEYHFTKDRSNGAWWERKRIRTFLPPVTARDPQLQQFIKSQGWKL